LSDLNTSKVFGGELLKHLSSAYRLARQLTRDVHDADDVVQEAYLRAFRYASGFRGEDARPWLLRIVRNVFYTSANRKGSHEPIGERGDAVAPDTLFSDPEETLVRKSIVQNALETLPKHCREVLMLREVEELSYKDISALLGVPRGTVMSRLSRARAQLRQSAEVG
jgi:RNA polymerase sigma factor (sigma-70 family)